MTWKKLMGMVAIGLLAALPSQSTLAQFGGLFGGPKVEIIATAELSKMLAEQRQVEAKGLQAGTQAPKPGFVVVDVRSEAEVNVSIIPGAITKAEFEKNRQQYEGQTVIPYCTVGGRSGAYAKQLAKEGVTVKNYKGSILEWVGAELPLVTLDGKSTNRVHTYSDRYRIPAKYQQVTE
jgi:rhodanese-related sulfurtransferase